MPARRKLSVRQLELLIEFAEGNRDIASGRFAGAMANQSARRAWEAIALRLNSVAEGSIKTPNEWKRYWIELKAKTKNKAANQRRHERGTGGGPNRFAPLSDLEKRILEIIGPAAVHGEPSVRLPSPIQTQNTQSTVETPMPEEWLDENLLTVNSSEEMSQPNIELATSAVATSQFESPLADVNTNTQALSLQEYNANAAPTDPQEPNRQADLPQHSRQTSLRRQRRRAILGVPQWALDFENRRMEVDLKITATLEALLSEVKEIKETLNKLLPTPSASNSV